ncbi:FecR family protein [Niabella sp.]|uniref:FecR family protein n=1 Tax=Niabella sp. TaxID=1962976 RepID=UPI002636A8D2|nr:FecR family protein [Niabella sp.]
MTSAAGRLTELFNKQLEEPISEAERQELFSYAMREELQPVLRKLVHAAWHKTGRTSDLPPEKAEKILEHILARSGGPAVVPHRRTVWMKWTAIAAACVLVLFSAIFWYNRSQKAVNPGTGQVVLQDVKPGSTGALLTLSDGRQVALDSLGNNVIEDGSGAEAVLKNGRLQYETKTAGQPVHHTVSTPRGKQFELVLPDGSKVWLNSASSISYPTAFTGPLREVSISGEVYFEVTKQASGAPFTVSCNHQKITVLGTRFNVNSYADVKTTLLEGKVRVQSDQYPVEKILMPGQQSIVANGTIQVQDADIDQVMAWKMGYFNFSDIPFSEIMQQLSRWYDIDVIYEGKVPRVEFEGKLNRAVNLSRVLEFFKDSGIRFRMENKTLIIY